MTDVNYPNQLRELARSAWDNYRTTLGRVRAAPKISGGKFVYRNVEIDWPAKHVLWRWPHRTCDTYRSLLRTGTRLRVLGEGWGMSVLTHPAAGGHVLLSGGPAGAGARRVVWGSRRDRLTCFSGATWREVHDFLERHASPMCLPNQPGFAELTVAGTLGVGGHGSGLRLGSLESMVTRLALASIRDPDAAPLVFHRGDPEFDCAVTHLGRLGPVISVELALGDAYRIAEQREIRVLGEVRAWQAELGELIREAIELQSQPDVHSVELWIAPYADAGRITAALGSRRYTTAPVSSEVTRPAVLRSRMLQTIAQLAVVNIQSVCPSWIRGVLRMTVENTRTQRVVLEMRDALDFGAPNCNRMAAIEAAFDLEDVGRAVSGVVRAIMLLEQLAVTQGRYVFSPLGVRFVGRGAEAGLSPQAARARTLHLEIPTFAGAGFHGAAVLRPVQRTLAAEYGARPHWGQRLYLSPEQLRALWPRRSIAQMASLVTRLDPQGCFANPLIDRMLGL